MSDSDFHDYVMHDLFAELPGITSRKMFGGYGIYKDGIIFGLIAYDVLYFKVDEINKPDYEKKGSKPFTYSQGNHKPTTMSYWELPADIMDDKEELKKWMNTSVEASIRTQKSKK